MFEESVLFYGELGYNTLKLLDTELDELLFCTMLSSRPLSSMAASAGGVILFAMCPLGMRKFIESFS